MDRWQRYLLNSGNWTILCISCDFLIMKNCEMIFNWNIKILQATIESDILNKRLLKEQNI